ncbi:MAG: TauD/TfdA family dioxygenase [Legionellaceae bacterium]|nr:TauD/TfdA family dioxygenase [Legionellaceae bacterium]
MELEKINYIQSENGSGKLCYYCANKEDADIIQFVEANRHVIEQQIHTHGGILLRHFSLRSVSEFNQLANVFSPNLLDYINRSTPRTRLGAKIYTATEYPPHKHILLHNENSYTNTWPDKILFFCIIVAQSGGETPVADGRCVLKKIDKKIIKKFNDKKILYKRNYTAGIDLSWQDVFQTSDTKEVIRYCDENNIQYVWHDASPKGLELTTQQICQATLKHPITAENVWFNQAHLFHISSLEAEDRNALLSVVSKDYLPRNTYYGDGSEIEVEDIKHIIDVYNSEKIIFQWEKGDVLILDNVLMPHARHPFAGERKIVVAMSSDKQANEFCKSS